LPATKLPRAAWFRAFAVALARELGLAGLMLKSAGASFAADCHQSLSRGLIATMQYASKMPKIQVMTIKPNIRRLIY
jgi:hypothetical protein